jgi:hypothetical protein
MPTPNFDRSMQPENGSAANVDCHLCGQACFNQFALQVSISVELMTFYKLCTGTPAGCTWSYTTTIERANNNLCIDAPTTTIDDGVKSIISVLFSGTTHATE